jgi:imidazolonepropionase-like amidohydrolase
MAADLEFVKKLRRDISEGRVVGPRIVAGQMIDGPHPFWPAVAIPISDEASARQTVESAKDKGADFLKVYSLIPRAAYFALADEAKKRGIPFAGHVPFLVSAAEASDAGQKSIEHLEGVLFACSSVEPEIMKNLEDAIKDAKNIEQIKTSVVRTLSEASFKALDTYSQEKAAALFARFAANGTWQAPTLVVHRMAAFLDDNKFTNDPRLKYVRRDIRESWKNPDDFRLKNRTEQNSARYKQAFRNRLETVLAMHRAGVKMLAATDAWLWYVFPGFSLHDELELFVLAGLSPMEALQTATRNPAIYLNLLDTVGTVEERKKADLVLLDANPLENISNTKKINAVVVNGRLFPRALLDKMLMDVERDANRN